MTDPLARLPVPFYVTDAPLPVFGLAFGAADGRVPRGPVLLCGPFGWEDSAAHRPLREWAVHLAARGHGAARIDLPGTGDSAGSPHAPGLVEAWTAGVAAAARALATRSGAPRVTVVALGLSAVVAVRAAASEPAIGDLVLWGVPRRGRQLVRQLQAFANLERASAAVDADGERVPVPQDTAGLTVGGFVLTDETQDALRQIDLCTVELPSGPRRILLLGRDGLPVDAPLRAHLEAQHATVAVADGAGYDAMTAHPQLAVAPQAAMATVDAWLATASDATPAATDAAPTGGQAALLALEGVREQPVTIVVPGAAAFAVVAEPTAVPTANLTVLFLNAGAIRRTGPNRMWVEAARRWAARGVPSLRVDVGSIGDAPRGFASYVEDDSLHGEGMLGDVVAAMDHAQERGLPGRFLLVGLCSGSSLAFNVALRDRRVVSTVLLNPRALLWSDELAAVRDARVGARVVRASQWKRVLRGEIERERLVAVAKAILRYPLGVAERRRLRRRLRAAFRRLDEADVRVALVFTGDEPLRHELGRDGHVGHGARWRTVSVVDVPGRDHTLRPLAEQRWVHEYMDRVVADAVGAPAAAVHD